MKKENKISIINISAMVLSGIVIGLTSFVGGRVVSGIKMEVKLNSLERSFFSNIKMLGDKVGECDQKIEDIYRLLIKREICLGENHAKKNIVDGRKGNSNLSANPTLGENLGRSKRGT